MTHRDQLCRPLGRHNARDARAREHIALGHCAVKDHAQRLRLHGQHGLRHSFALRDRLCADVHHVRCTVFIQMGQFHVVPRSLFICR